MKRIIGVMSVAVVVFCALVLPSATVYSQTAPGFVRSGAVRADFPTGVALDGVENVYVAESSNNRVRVFSRSGRYLGAITGLDKPISVAVDLTGRIYIGNDATDNVAVYSPDYSLLFKLGIGDGEVRKPTSIKVDGFGDIYVVDSKADRVKVYSAGGARKFSFGGAGSTDGLFNFPTAIAINEATQTVVVADCQEISSIIGTPQMGARIQIFDMGGGHIRSFGTFGRGEGLLVRPLGLAVDSLGRIYVADTGQDLVQVFDETGNYLTSISDPDNPLQSPVDIAMGPLSGSLFVAAKSLSRIDVYDHASEQEVVAPKSFTFSVEGNGSDYVSFANGSSVGAGGNQVVSIAVPSGYRLVDLLVDGVSVGPQTSYTFSDVAANHTIEPVFEEEGALSLEIVKPVNYVEGEPSTYPLLAGSGTEWSCQATGGSGAYHWVVRYAADRIVDELYSSSATYTVHVDSLFANGAGIYSVTVADADNPDLAPASINVRVPLRINPMFGNHKDTDGGVEFTVTGATGTFRWSLLDEGGNDLNNSAIGLSVVTGGPTNTVTLQPGIAAVTAFQVQAKIDDPLLEAAEIDRVIAGPQVVVPMTRLVVEVLGGAGGATRLAGATVTAVHDPECAVVTDASGAAMLPQLANTGAVYRFAVQKEGYLPAIFSTTDLRSLSMVTLVAAASPATISGEVTPVGTGSEVELLQADGTPICGSSDEPIRVLADPVSGAFTLPFDLATAGTGPYQVAASRPGAIFSPEEDEGTVEANAGDSGKVIALHGVTKVAVADDGGSPNLSFSITADPPFDNREGEIQAFAGETKDASEVTAALAYQGEGTYVYTVVAPGPGEAVSLLVKADTSTSSRAAASGYRATALVSTVAGLSAPAEMQVSAPHYGGAVALTSPSGQAEVALPAGGVGGEILSAVTVSIREADSGSAGVAAAGDSDLLAVALRNATTGESIDSETVNKLFITLAFDPAEVTEGAFESGAVRIWQAESLPLMQDGQATAVPVGQILRPIDYAAGKVTFWVDAPGAFVIGR